MEIEIEIYEKSSTKRPFEKWFEDIREIHTRAKILTRLTCISHKLLGELKHLSFHLNAKCFFGKVYKPFHQKHLVHLK